VNERTVPRSAAKHAVLAGVALGLLTADQPTTVCLLEGLGLDAFLPLASSAPLSQPTATALAAANPNKRGERVPVIMAAKAHAAARSRSSAGSEMDTAAGAGGGAMGAYLRLRKRHF